MLGAEAYLLVGRSVVLPLYVNRLSCEHYVALKSSDCHFGKWSCNEAEMFKF